VSAFRPSLPHTDCSWCRRTYNARHRGKPAEVELLVKYNVLDDHLSTALGTRWPEKLLLAEAGFFT
jgi:hypothetical protein